MLDKSRDAHVDAFQSLADRCDEQWRTIIDTRPRYSGNGIDSDTLSRFGEVLSRLAAAQGRVNTMLSEAIYELERGSRE